MLNELLLFGAGLLTAVPTIGTAQERTDSLPGWLAGCWILVRGDLVIEEQWMAPRAGTMLGMSRTTRGSAVTGFESTMISVDGGRVVYTADPSGQSRAVFRMTERRDDAVVFADPEHDFPQRIGYERIGSDSLHAWIDGTVDGISRSIAFAYRRIACPPADSSP
jgi:hypothetical protein